MKTLKCLISVPDKYTGKQYQEGKEYEFEDARADEILAARTRVTGEPFFEEVKMPELPEAPEVPETPEAPENTSNNVENIGDLQIGESKEVVLEDMKVAELKELATKMNIEKADKMKKEELIEAIKNNG